MSRRYKLGPLSPPTWLNPSAKKIFRKTAHFLRDVGASCDRDLVALYSQTLATFIKASEQLEREGLVIQGKNGATRNPLAVLVNQSRAGVMKLSTLLGLNPMGRNALGWRVKGGDEDGDDEQAK